MKSNHPKYSIAPVVPQSDASVWQVLEAQVAPPKNARKIAKGVILSFSISLLIAVFVPWQQNVRGTGRVIAFSPNNRTQKIQATITGKADSWFVNEGQKVKKGDPIVELRDNDDQLSSRLQGQRNAIDIQRATKEQSIALLKMRAALIREKQQAQISIAEQELLNAKQDVIAAEQAVLATEIELETDRLNLERQKDLFSKGLSSKRTLELSELSFQQSQSKHNQANSKLRINTGKVKAKKHSLQQIRASTEADIRSLETSLQKSTSELAEVQTKTLKLETQIARQNSQTILAPMDGIVFRIFGRSGGEQFKQGDVLATLVPDTEDRSVELFVDGRDAPLVQKGSLVRLQFEGWPALQFSGWPSVAVGTFGGRVSFVDPADDGNGNFRILVVTDPGDEPWPDAKYLRQGVRTKGWFLLDQVPLGYEVWRLFNGFPPALKTQPDKQLFHGDSY